MRRIGLALGAIVISIVTLVPVAAQAGTKVFTGSVDAAGASWKAFLVDVTAPSAISASLDWTTTSANLNLFLYDPTGAQVAMTTSTTKRPETITYNAQQSGSWKLGVKAKTGASAFTLTVDGVDTGGPAYLTILF